MIEEEKILREIRWLEKEIEGMKYPTKGDFKRAIKQQRKAGETQRNRNTGMVEEDLK